MEESLEIKKQTKGRLPSLPFTSIKEKVLGKKYELSLVFIGDTTSAKLNKKYRNKEGPTNILSFPYTENNGEIFIDLRLVKKQAPNFNKSYKNFLGLLLIHGMLHLKGYDHGEDMEKLENKFSKLFKF